MPTKRQALRKRLAEGTMIVAPGIYDAYGARFVEQAGFEAVYMTGNGVSASLLGRPDVGLIDPQAAGLGADPWGNASGAFLSTMMRRMQTPIASRWGAMALRNALIARSRAPRRPKRARGLDAGDDRPGRPCTTHRQYATCTPRGGRSAPTGLCFSPFPSSMVQGPGAPLPQGDGAARAHGPRPAPPTRCQ